MKNSLAVAHVVLLEMIRRRDIYVLLFLSVLITLLLGSINLFGDERIARYLKEACLTLIWLSSVIIAVTSAARQIPAEKESLTIFPLLAKPISRWQVLFGKFLGCWAASALALAAFYLFFCIISGSREQYWPLTNYGQAYLLHVMFCGIVVAMALLGSVVFSAAVANATFVSIVVFGILAVGRHLNKVAGRLDEPAQSLVRGIYYAVPHLEFYDVRDLIIHNWEPVPWFAVLRVGGYAVTYVAVLFVVTALVFRRQPLNT